jgi:hypothetical protein
MTQAQLPTSAILAYHSLEKSGAVQLRKVELEQVQTLINGLDKAIALRQQMAGTNTTTIDSGSFSGHIEVNVAGGGGIASCERNQAAVASAWGENASGVASETKG